MGRIPRHVIVFLGGALLTFACVLCSCSSQQPQPMPGPQNVLPPLTGLPELPEAGSGENRSTSDDEQERAGDVLFDQSTSNVAVDSGAHTAVFTAPAGQIGWTVQEFNIGASDPVGSVGCTISGLESGEMVYVCVSDYSSGRWSALPAQGNGTFTIDLNDATGVFSNGSSMYVAVISYGATFTLEFTRVIVTADFSSWHHNWGTTGMDAAGAIERDSDSSLLVGGEIDGRALSGGESVERRLVVLRFSPDGEILKSRMFSWPSPDDEFGNSDCAFSAMLLGDGGAIYLLANCVDGSLGYSRGMLLRLDDQLEVQWAMLYGDADNRVELNAADFDSFGNIVCCGTRRGDDFGVTDDALQIVVDADNGSVVAKHLFPLGGLELESQEQVLHMDLDPASDRIMMAGDVYVADSSADQYILCTNTAGSVQWAASFGGASGFDSATAVVRGDSGSTIVTGTLDELLTPNNNCSFLTISPLGQLAGVHTYTDADAEGFYVRKLEVDELGEGFIATGQRLDAVTFILAPTSIIPFAYDSLLPGAGVDYGFWFDDYVQSGNIFYSAGFFNDSLQQSFSGTATTFPAGSSNELIGMGAFFSLTVGSQVADLTAESFTAVEADHEGRLDATLADNDFDLFVGGLDLGLAP